MNETTSDVVTPLDLPKMPATPPELFDVKMEVLPGARRAIAVNGQMLYNNEYQQKPHQHEPIFEVHELPADEDGNYDLRRAKKIGNFRHVEILGPAWLHHSPETPLAFMNRRVGVMVTDAPLRVFSDKPEFVEKVVKEREEQDAARRAAAAKSGRSYGCG